MKNYYQPGDWNAVCSMCGRKKKASDLVRNWQGLYRCKDHNEERHPQDFVRGVREVVTVPWAQPMTDIDIYVCDINGRSAVPGRSVPGCMMPGNTITDDSINWAAVSACTIFGRSSLPEWMMPGCAIPGFAIVYDSSEEDIWDGSQFR